jgi:hypothetical protein
MADVIERLGLGPADDADDQATLEDEATGLGGRQHLPVVPVPMSVRRRTSSAPVYVCPVAG